MADFRNMFDAKTAKLFGGSQDIYNYAEQLMQQQYAWGKEQFAKNSQLTDQVVGDLMGLYGQLTGVGNQLMGQYQQLFEPEYKQLVNDANNYSSQARIQQAMGAAESGVAQQFNGQRNAALADLQSFGIDPSSGRYASLDAAERTQQAAAQAGAGFQAEQATEAVGRGLRSEALQLGSVMPSQATAAYNAAGGAATAAENAKLANSQEGVNMLGSPTQYGAISASRRGGVSGGQAKSPGGGGREGGNQVTPNEPESRWNFPANQPTPDDGSGGGHGGVNFGPGGGGGGGLGESIPVLGGGGGGDGGEQYGPPTPEGGVQMGPSTAGQEGSPYYGPATDSALPADNSGGSTDTGSTDTGSSDFSQPSYDDSGYAEGGAIPNSRSPSRGKNVDDVRARVNQTNEPVRLNAGEHVMTRDAVKMKGRKFFDDINRKARGGAIPTSRAYA